MDIREPGFLVCAPARICKPNYWSWQVNTNWFNHPSFGSGFQIWFLRPVVKLIKTDCKIEQTFLPDPIREHFWFMKRATHLSLPIVFLLFVLLFVFLCQWRIMAWPPNVEAVKADPSFLKQRQYLYCHVVIIESNTDDSLNFFSVSLCVEISIVSCDIGIVILLCWASRFGLLFGAPLARNLRNSQVSRIVLFSTRDCLDSFPYLCV
jgi:hypothetical protein